MQFTTITLAAFIGLVASTAVPAAQGNVLKQRLDDGSGSMIVARSFPCASNDPNVCCACRGGFGTCINGQCSCNGGDC